MKKWGLSILVIGFIIIGMDSITVKAEEIDEHSSMQETVETEMESDEISMDEGGDESPESVVEFDSETEQEQVMEPQVNLKSRSSFEDCRTEPYQPTDALNEMTPRAIIGKDDRFRVTNTTAFPNRAVGFIEVTFPTGNTFKGTAAMVGNNVALTAGHMLYDKSEGGWAKQVTYYPGRNGNSSPLGSYRGRKFISSQTFMNTGNRAYDWGVIRFDTNPGGKHGYFGFQTTTKDQTGTKLYTRGYPGDKARGTMYGCSGILKGYINNKLRLIYTIDTWSGQSGSPVYDSSRTIYAVHTHGGGTGTKYTYGRRIDKTLFDVLKNGRKW